MSWCTETRSSAGFALSIAVIAAMIAAASYVTTRGTDGRPMEAIGLFTVIAFVRLAMLLKFSFHAGLLRLAMETAIFAAAACTVFVDTRLDGMGGIMVLLIPAMAFGVSVIPRLAAGLIRLAGCRRHRSDRG